MIDNNCLTEQQITLYCSEALSPEQMQSAAEHFAGCLHCRSTMESIRKALEVVPHPELHLSNAEKLQFTDRVMQASKRRHRGSRLQVWGSAATAITAGALAFFVFSPGNLPTQPDQHPALQYAEFDLVENIEMLEELEFLEMMDLLELLEDKS